MLKGCISTLILIFLGIYGMGLQTVSLSPTAEAPSGSAAEQIVSPNGRYVAQLYRCCDIYNYISGFQITDTQTGQAYIQNLADVENLNSLAGGIYFAWTPSEHYVVISTDNRVTSHGCDEVLVYSGDGRELVYSSVPTSICSFLTADAGLGVLDLCANDDILLTSGEWLIPATGVRVPTRDKNCGLRM
jgi:hypothetical protein